MISNQQPLSAGAGEAQLHPPASPGHYATTRAKSPERTWAVKGAAQQSAEYLNPLGWTPLVELPNVTHRIGAVDPA